MTVRLLHAADIHLGYQQYGSPERYSDFAAAFMRMVSDALDRRVDAVLLAGDLFDRRDADPQSFLQVATALNTLHRARIPVLAIIGNHERSRYQAQFSWLDCLAGMGLLILLNAEYVEGTMQVLPWDSVEHRGAYYDLPGGVRVLGIHYVGASTALAVRDLAARLAEWPDPRPAYTVLMLHAGLEGILDGYSGALKRSDLEQLRPYVDYIALGHIHKPFIQEDWLYNPGSLETHSIDEAAWEERGYLIVEIDSEASPKHRVTAVRGQRRPFLRLTLEVDAFRTPDELYAGLATYLATRSTTCPPGQRPVVEITLKGVLAFRAAELETARVELAVQARCDALLVLFKDQTSTSAFEVRAAEAPSRRELERAVVRGLVEREERMRPASEELADLVLELKRLALEGRGSADILAALGAWPLADQDVDPLVAQEGGR